MATQRKTRNVKTIADTISDQYGSRASKTADQLTKLQKKSMVTKLKYKNPLNRGAKDDEKSVTPPPLSDALSSKSNQPPPGTEITDVDNIDFNSFMADLDNDINDVNIQPSTFDTESFGNFKIDDDLGDLGDIKSIFDTHTVDLDKIKKISPAKPAPAAAPPAAAPAPNPSAAPLPGNAPMAAPPPGGAPMAPMAASAPVPGGAPMAPMATKSAAPMPGGAPMAPMAPKPVAAAPMTAKPGGAPMAPMAPKPAATAPTPAPKVIPSVSKSKSKKKLQKAKSKKQLAEEKKMKLERMKSKRTLEKISKFEKKMKMHYKVKDQRERSFLVMCDESKTIDLSHMIAYIEHFGNFKPNKSKVEEFFKALRPNANNLISFSKFVHAIDEDGDVIAAFHRFEKYGLLHNTQLSPEQRKNILKTKAAVPLLQQNLHKNETIRPEDYDKIADIQYDKDGTVYNPNDISGAGKVKNFSGLQSMKHIESTMSKDEYLSKRGKGGKVRFSGLEQSTRKIVTADEEEQKRIADAKVVQKQKSMFNNMGKQSTVVKRASVQIDKSVTDAAVAAKNKFKAMEKQNTVKNVGNKSSTKRLKSRVKTKKNV